LEPNCVFPRENGFQLLITKDFPLIFRVLQNIVVCHAPEIKKRQEAGGRHATELSLNRKRKKKKKACNRTIENEF